MSFHPCDPSTLVASVFGRIAETRMAGLPVCNPSLSVEAIGFQVWSGIWIGVLITPWAINLLILPAETQSPFRPIRVGESQVWAFPSGAYDFLGNEEPGLGSYQCCSLFSPAFEFASQEDARAVAREALNALMEPSGDEAGSLHPAAADARSPGAGPVSRRRFLRGFVGGA